MPHTKPLKVLILVASTGYVQADAADCAWSAYKYQSNFRHAPVLAPSLHMIPMQLTCQGHVPSHQQDIAENVGQQLFILAGLHL